jgi:hypothetical protein
MHKNIFMRVVGADICHSIYIYAHFLGYIMTVSARVVIISLVTFTRETTGSTACSRAIIQQAISDGFPQYLLSTCTVEDGSSFPINPTVCMNTWIAQHSSMPSSGDCFTAFALVLEWIGRSSGAFLHRNFLATVLEDLASAPLKDACGTDVVDPSTDQRFLDFVVLNCMQGHSSTENFLGSTPQGPAECLAKYILSLSSPPKFSSGCRLAYQHLADALSSVPYTDFITSVSLPCSYENGELVYTSECLNAISAPLATFASESGTHVGGNAQCNGFTVRKLAQRDTYSQIMALLADSNPVNPISGDYIDPLSDNGNPFCYLCYAEFFTDIMAAKVIYPELVDLCADSPNSETCMGVTPVAEAMARFKKCAGGYDIIFNNAVCSRTQVETVAALVPTPFYLLTHCTFNASDFFCYDIDTYLAGIAEATSESCGWCYRDYNDDIRILGDDAKTACSGDIHSQQCLAAVSMPLFKFRACTGSNSS